MDPQEVESSNRLDWSGSIIITCGPDYGSWVISWNTYMA